MKRTAVCSILTALILSAPLLFVVIPHSEAAAESPQPQWSRTYSRNLNYSVNGNPVSAKDEGRSVIQTTDGGYAIFASLDDYHFKFVDNRTSMVIKTDPSGIVEWEKGNSIIASDPRSIFQTKDSGFLLVGDERLVKLDAEGNVQWSRDFGSYFRAIQVRDGGYVLAGFVQQGSDYVGMLLKTDEDGDLLWNRSFPASSGSSAYGVVETVDGGYAFAGRRDGAWFGLTDSNGNLEVNKNFHELDAYFTAIAKTNDGGFILVGGDSPGSVVQGKAIIAKVNSHGEMLWNHSYKNTQNAGLWFSSVAQTIDGGLVAVGYDSIFKVDASGNLQWYALGSTDVADFLGSTNSVVATEDGGFAVVGGKDSSVWLVKFASESNPIFLTTLIAATVAVVAAVLLVVYWKKRRR